VTAPAATGPNSQSELVRIEFGRLGPGGAHRRLNAGATADIDVAAEPMS